MAAPDVTISVEGDREMYPPVMTGKQVALMVDEVAKILKTQGLITYTPQLPMDVQGGDLYIVRPSTTDLASCWKADGNQWKICGTFHLPRQRKPIFCKRTYVNILPDGTVNTGIKKEVYVREVGEEDDNVCLVHYMGHFSDTRAEEIGQEISLVQLPGGKTESTYVVGSDVSSILPQQSVQLGTDTAGTYEGGGDTGLVSCLTSLTPAPEAASMDPDLETAMKSVKAALASSSGPIPVVDVFNKLLETVVNDPSNPDLEYCLVVKNKKSDEKALNNTGDSHLEPVPSTDITEQTKDNMDLEAEPGSDCKKDIDTNVKLVSTRNTRKRPAETDSDCMQTSAVSPVPKRSRAAPKEVSKVGEVEMSNGDILKFPQPRKEVFFGYSIVVDEEKKINRDLFDGKQGMRGKDKYLKMRNYIIESWTKQKPTFFTVSQAVKELSSVGDAKQIERIHTYLVCKGVINFNAVQIDQTGTRKSARQSKDIAVHSEDKLLKELSETNLQPMRGRKKSTNLVQEDIAEVPNIKDGKRSIQEGSSEQHVTKLSKVEHLKSGKNVENYSKIKGKIVKPETPVSNKKDEERFSGRRTRNVSTPNWADILSGKKEFSRDNKYASASPQRPDVSVKKSPRKLASGKAPYKTDVKKVVGKQEGKAIEKVKRNVESCKKLTNIEEDKGCITNKTKPVNEPDIITDNPADACFEVDVNSFEADSLTQEIGKSNSGGSDSPHCQMEITKDVEHTSPLPDFVNEICVDDNTDQLKMPFDNEEKNTDGGNADENETNKVKLESPGRSTRCRKTYDCSVCKKKFSVQYLLEEHVKLHSALDQRKGEEEAIEEKVLQKRTEEKASGDKNINEDDEYDDAADPDFPESGVDVKVETDVSTKDLKVKISADKAVTPERMKTLRLGRIKRQPRTLPGTNKPTCSECGSVFLNEANLRRHSLLHSDKMYECPYCAKIMKRKDYILTHIRKVHREVDLNKTPVDWSKYTHDITQINKQVKTSPKKEEDINAPKDDYDMNAESENSCPLCQEILNSKDDLEQHVQKDHGKELKDLVYTCVICKEEFRTYLAYEVHKTTHKKKAHVCPHCKRVFRSTAQLQVHKRHDHNIQYGTLMYFGFLMNNGRITCEVCSSEFDSMAEYHEHRPTHLTLERLCTECGNGFMTEEELNKHVESKCTYQNLHLPCGVCDQRFTIYDTRRKHILSFHPKTTDFYCHHCGISFNEMETLRMHFLSHKEEKIYECEFCEKRFFEKRNLVDHRDLHKSSKNFPCHICDRLYISAKSLQRHLKLHLGQDKKKCQYCSRLFKTNEELQQHEASHTNDSSGITDNDLSCSICLKLFSSKQRLVKHMQKHSEGEQERSYTCIHCNEEFNMVSMPLWKHLKLVHPEEAKKQKKDLVCETCGFSTIYKQRLDRHLETHFADKRFVCPVCHKRFQTTSSLLTHLIIHRGKVRKGVKDGYACSWPDCNKLLMKRSYYKKHLISHIFRIKVGKDVCLCMNCSNNTAQSNFILLQEGADGTLQFVEDRKLSSKEDTSTANQTTMNVVLTSGGHIQSYESMNVLQQAIAQIEDIEKSSEDTVKQPDHSLQNCEISKSEVQQREILSNPIEMVEHNDLKQQVDVTTEILSAVDAGNIVNQVTHAPAIHVDEENLKNTGEPTVLQQSATVFDRDGAVTLTDLQKADGNVQPEEGTLSHDAFAESALNIVRDEGDGLVEMEDGIYECGACERKFSYKCQVLQHFEGSHPDDAFPTCEVCAKIFLDQKNLADHMSVHTGDKVYMCEVCNKNFRTKQCLRQHKFIHADVKPFICSFCGHGFTQRGFFEEHVRRHTGQKPYKCTECPKSFVSKNLLKVHYYSHSGLKPHKCDYCSKAFAEHYQLVTHLRVHNQERPYQCNLCEKSFFMKAKVMRHLNTVHNVDKSMLSNYVPTRVRDGIGYRDKTKLKNYVPDAEPRKTQVVYIDSQGNIVSQVMKTTEEIRKEKEGRKIETPKPIKPQQAPFMFIKPLEQISIDETSSHSDSLGSFEVFTRRDSSGQIKVDTIVPGSEHMVVESTDTGDTIVSIPEPDPKQDVIQYEQFQPIENDGSIDLDGQNYTFVSADGQSVENHLELITHALQAQSDAEQGGIQVVTEEIPGAEQVHTDADGNIEIYANMCEQEEVEETEEQENFSINIGEDGSVDPADYEKIEALRNLYSDQPIVIVVEQQQEQE